MKRVAQLLALTVGSSLAAFAVDTCVTGTLANYAVDGYSCTLGSRTFSNFSLAAATGSNFISSSDVEIRPWADNNGFTFVLLRNNRAEANTITDFTLKYLGTNPGGGRLDVGVQMVASVAEPGNVSLFKDACNGAGFASSGDACGLGGSFVKGAHLGFPPDLGPSRFTVGNSVNIFGVREQAILTAGAGGFAQLDQFDNFYAGVPEPSSYILTAAGFLAIAYLRRRKRA